jgi:hypothetical protein
VAAVVVSGTKLMGVGMTPVIVLVALIQVVMTCCQNDMLVLMGVADCEHCLYLEGGECGMGMDQWGGRE